MLDSYRAVYRVPGAAAFSAAGFIARLSIAVYPLGLVLLISLRTGHYTFAGLLSGTYVIANGIGTPALSRLADRWGQRRVLVPSAGVHCAAVIAVIALAQAKAPDWTLLLPTVVLGLSYVSVGSLVRARWSLVLGGRAELTTAYSIESTLDEVIFTLGPLLATVVATQAQPVWVFVIAAALVAAGSLWLRAQPDTEPPAHPPGAERYDSAMRTRGMVLLFVVAVAMGAMFASAEVTMVAFCGQRHHSGLAGIALAAFATGSAVSGFFYGARAHARPMLDRFRRQCLLIGALPLLFLLAVNIPVLDVLAVTVGLGIAPALITLFGVIEEIVPPQALTEGMSWPITGLSLGYGVAAAIVGRVADAFGARPAFLGAVVSGAVVIGFGLLVHDRLRAAPAS